MRRPMEEGMLRRLLVDEGEGGGRPVELVEVRPVDGRRLRGANGATATGVTQHGQAGVPVGSRFHMSEGLSTASSKMGCAVDSRAHMGERVTMGSSEMSPPADGRSHIGADLMSLCSG